MDAKPLHATVQVESSSEEPIGSSGQSLLLARSSVVRQKGGAEDVEEPLCSPILEKESAGQDLESRSEDSGLKPPTIIWRSLMLEP